MVGTGPIARALEAPRIEDVTNDTARSFRAFAEQTGSDLKALAACMRGPREKITAEDLARIAVPTLVATGSRDVIAGSGEELARLIPGAQLLDIAGPRPYEGGRRRRFQARCARLFNQPGLVQWSK